MSVCRMKRALLTGLSFVMLSISHGQGVPVIRFGKFETHGPQTTTIKRILSDPKLTVNNNGCKVTGFDVSGMAPGKEYIGPYTSTSNKLTEAQIRYIKSLYPECQLWINHIHVKCKGGVTYEIGTGRTEFSIYFFNIVEE
jgi:hypothetical protein